MAGLIVAGASVLLATTVVPTLLAFLGARIEAGSFHFLKNLTLDSSASVRDRWRRWGRDRHQSFLGCSFIAGTPLLVLAMQAARLDTNLPRGEWLPRAAESVQAFHSLERMGRAGIVQSLRVILELPSDSISKSDAGWNGVVRLSRTLAADPRADRVISLSTLTESNRYAVAALTSETRRSFLRSDEAGATLLELLPAPSVSTADQTQWVRELRRANASELTGVAGAAIRIDGDFALKCRL